MRYLIWSFEHDAWWKPSHRGYTENIAEAGVYSQDEAIRICIDANLYADEDGVNEAMVPVGMKVWYGKGHGDGETN